MGDLTCDRLVLHLATSQVSRESAECDLETPARPAVLGEGLLWDSGIGLIAILTALFWTSGLRLHRRVCKRRQSD